MKELSAGLVVFLVLAVFIGGGIAGGVGRDLCAEYNPTVNSFRASICPTVGNAATWPTLALAAPLFILLVSVASRKRWALWLAALAFLLLDVVVIALVALAAS